jgi:hypothetical protein
MLRELSIGGTLYPANVFNQYLDYPVPIECGLSLEIYKNKLTALLTLKSQGLANQIGWAVLLSVAKIPSKACLIGHMRII